jgi:hypothetical protein
LRPDGRLVVADPLSRRVMHMGSDGSSPTLVTRARCSSLGYPAALAVLPDGGVLIADTGAARVLIARDGNVRPIAGAGLRRPSHACGDATARAELTAPAAPRAGTPDHTYAPPTTPPVGASPGPAPRVLGPCAPRPRWTFSLRFLYLQQGGRVVRQPSSRSGFRAYFYVSVRARLVAAVLRRGHLRWRYPRRGATRPRGGRVAVRVRRLSRGPYQLVMRAESPSRQRICHRLRFRVRR